MLHPRSVWSPPTPTAKLPELPADSSLSGAKDDEDRDEGRPNKKPTHSDDTSLETSPQLEANGHRAGKMKEQTPKRTGTRPLAAEPIAIGSPPLPPDSPAPDFLADLSQETAISAPIITPNSSFNIDANEQEVEGSESLPFDPARSGLCMDPIYAAQASIIGLTGKSHASPGPGR